MKLVWYQKNLHTKLRFGNEICMHFEQDRRNGGGIELAAERRNKSKSRAFFSPALSSASMYRYLYKTQISYTCADVLIANTEYLGAYTKKEKRTEEKKNRPHRRRLSRLACFTV